MLFCSLIAEYQENSMKLEYKPRFRINVCCFPSKRFFFSDDTLAVSFSVALNFFNKLWTFLSIEPGPSNEKKNLWSSHLKAWGSFFSFNCFSLWAEKKKFWVFFFFFFFNSRPSACLVEKNEKFILITYK